MPTPMTGHLQSADRDPALRRARAHETLADRLRKIADEVQAMGGET
jgi:hypothetical protein